MLLRLSTLATGRTGVRLETAQTLAALLNARHHAGRARVRLARLLRRPRAAGALRAGADGRGGGPRRRRRPDAGRRRARRGRPHAGRARRQGGPGPDQRHRRDARHAGAGHRRPADAAADRRHRRRHVRRGAARHRPGLRRRPPGAAAAARARPRRRANLRALLAGSGVVASAPRTRLQPRPGRLLAALLAAGARRRPRHRRPRGAGRRPRAGLGDRQPGRAATTAGSSRNGNFHGAPVAYVLDFLAIAGRRRGLDGRAAHRPVPRQGAQPRPAAVPRRRPRRRQRAT